VPTAMAGKRIQPGQRLLEVWRRKTAQHTGSPPHEAYNERDNCSSCFGLTMSGAMPVQQKPSTSTKSKG